MTSIPILPGTISGLIKKETKDKRANKAVGRKKEDINFNLPFLFLVNENLTKTKDLCSLCTNSVPVPPGET